MDPLPTPDDMRVVVALVGVLGVVAGALIAGAVAVVTGALTRRHENLRWQKDKRLEAFVAFNSAAYGWILAYTNEAISKAVNDPIKPKNEPLKELSVRGAEVVLLCSEPTREVVEEVLRQALASATWGARAETDGALDRMTHFMSELTEAQRSEIKGKTPKRNKETASAPENFPDPQVPDSSH